jgi:magnesium-transporting ATPase (P-type)
MEVTAPAHLAFAAQFGLGGVFLLSAIPKLHRPRAFVEDVVAYRILPAGMARAFGLALIPTEAFLAAAFFSGWWTSVALPLAAVLLVAFLVAVGVNLRRGRRVSCGCFGNATERISLRTAARLLLLLVVVLLLIAVRSVGDAAIPRLGSLPADVTVPVYLLETAALSAFLVVLSVWALALPELGTLARALGPNWLSARGAAEEVS